MTGEKQALSVTSVIVMNAMRRMGEKATGLALSRRTGIDEGYIYNLLKRLKARKYIIATATGVGMFRRYSLTEAGERYLDDVKAALR